VITVVGIDLSTTSLGLCAIPGAWDPSNPKHWELVTRKVIGTAPGLPRVERMQMLADDVVRFILGLGVERQNLRICHEGYPLGGGGGMFSLDTLIELGGLVKRAIWFEPRLHVELWSAAEMTARKLVCGKCPPKNRKLETARVLRSLAFGTLDAATLDECDAIVAANLYCKHLGLRHVWTPEPPKVKRTSKRRSRTQAGQLVIGGDR
jgi:hypothetical protein